MEQCALCFRNVSKAELFSVSDCGKKTFECKDEKVCREIADNARKNHALLIKTNRSLTFKEKYGVDITDLIELPRLRDASIHYYDASNNRIFTQKLWDNDGEMEINDSPQLKRLLNL
jgi:hypothetical protein